MDKPRLRGPASLWFFAWMSVGCGSGDFSADFAQEIEKDCYETLGCAAVGNIPAPATTMQCVKRTGDTLNKASNTQQQLFVDTVGRCNLSALCEYIVCTQSNTAAGFAATHQAQITYECQQKVACRVGAGQTSATNAVNLCVMEQSSILNAADPATQAATEQRYLRCASYAGCSYGACP